VNINLITFGLFVAFLIWLTGVIDAKQGR